MINEAELNDICAEFRLALRKGDGAAIEALGPRIGAALAGYGSQPSQPEGFQPALEGRIKGLFPHGRIVVARKPGRRNGDSR
jgi:hypothetical protein